MRIMIIAGSVSGSSGWSRYSRDVVKEIQSLGHDVLCLTSRKRKGNDIMKEYRCLANQLEHLSNPVWFFYNRIKITKTISEFQPDVIHFTAEPYALSLPFLRVGNSKTFLTVHGGYSFMPNLVKGYIKRIASYLTKKMYEKVNGVVSVSHYTKNYLLKEAQGPRINLANKIKVITNGVDLDRFNGGHLIDKFPEKVKRILHVGIVKPRKGILCAIDGLKYYHDSFSPDFVYYVVGNYNQNDESYRAILQKIKDYKLEDKVIFKGKVSNDELIGYYNKADLFLMLPIKDGKKFEGFGLVYLEANAMGIPCIGSKDCGAEEAILDGKTGYLVNPYNTKEVAEKMNLILNKNAIKPEECISWAEKNDIKIKARELLDFYMELLA